MTDSAKKASPIQPVNAHAGALWAARRGVPVLRVIPNGKDPYATGVNEATTDTATVDRWFRDKSNLNYGMAMGDGLVALDADLKHPSYYGDYPNLAYPDTLEMVSGGGGNHIVLRVDFDAGQAKLAGAPSIDVRARGGYIVGPGSVVDGRRYTIYRDTEIAECPPELAARISRRNAKPATADKSPMRETDQPDAMRDGWGLVASTAGLAESEGKGRNATAHALAGHLKRLGVSESTAVEMVTAWGAKCSPILEPDEVSKAVGSSYANGDWRIGEARPDGEFDDISAAVATTMPGKKLLEFSSDINLADLIARRETALVRGILHPGDDATMYGDSTAGKSFVAVHLAYHIALGLPWQGFKVKRAPALYIALEGVGGFRERVIAATKVYGDPGTWFARLNVPVTLDKTADGAAGGRTVIEACQQLEAACGQRVGLVVVDTRARATAGEDELKIADLMAYARRVGELVAGTGAAVLTIDHENEHGQLRGARPKKGAAEVLIRVVRNAEGDERSVIAAKVKDGHERTLFDFTIKPVHLGEYSDGETFGSAVIEATAPRAPEKPDSKAQRFFREAYADVAQTGADPVALSAIRERFMALYPAAGESEKQDGATRRRAWADALGAIPSGLERYGDKGECVRASVICDKNKSRKGTNPVEEFPVIYDPSGPTCA